MRRNWVAECTIETNYQGWIERLEKEERLKRGKPVLTGILDDYEVILGEGVKLSDDALLICESFLRDNPDTDVVYGDEDWMDEKGERFFPWFKPEFSPDSLLCTNYFESFVLVKKSLMTLISKETKGYELALSILDRTDKIRHVKGILSHRQADNPTTTEEEMEIKNAWLKRNGIAGHSEKIPETGLSRIVYDVVGEPLVSVIIPSKDNLKLLKRVIYGLRGHTRYQNFEIIIVDNGSSEENKQKIQKLCKELNDLEINRARKTKYIHGNYDFNFSKMCNIGREAASGDYLLLLNDDIEMIPERDDWLSKMLGTAMQPHAGAVGAKLYYPVSKKNPTGKLIQHDGVVSIYAGAAHFMTMYDDEKPLSRFQNRVDMDMIAVTAACLLVSTKKYDEAGGMNEDIAVAFNDVDFCMKLYEAGYYNILRNDAVLIHHESISRGDDNMDPAKKERMLLEREKLFKLHPKFEAYDPFRHPYFNPFEPDARLNYFLIENTDLNLVRDEYKTGSKLAGRMVMGTFDVTGRLVIAGSCVFILNDKSPLKIFFKGKKGLNFEVDAKRFYRPEIKKRFFYYPNIAYGSFRAIIDIDLLPKDHYELYLVRHGKAYRAPCDYNKK